MTWRYMQEWSHPYGMGGITYIATGMDIRMMNDARIANMSYRYKRDYFAEIEAVDKVWETRKARWNKAAEVAPTLHAFLKENFYDKN